MAVLRATRSQVLRYRSRAQGLAPAKQGPATGVLDPAVLDLGVQDTGPDGALWALAVRGVPVDAGAWPEELALAWTVRGAPHAYRRSELPRVAAAVRPWSHADAAKRVYDAAKPLRAASIPVGMALATVATALRDLVREPMVKGEVSGRLTALLPEPYLVQCRACGVKHPYEMPFRLAAIVAGLALEPGTSPPVLTPVDGWASDHIDALARLPETADVEQGRDTEPAEPLDPLSAVPRLLGPVPPADLAGYLDAPLGDVRSRLAARLASGELVEVDVDGTPSVLPADRLGALQDAAEPTDADRDVRLLGPYDLLLQGRDRELLVPDAARRKGLFPALGRPGAVLVDGEVVGTWRPRASGRRLTVRVEPWSPWGSEVEQGVDRQIERLGRHRGASATTRA